jgi:Family of unknown function (DUF6088)
LSISSQVAERINRLKRGIPFSINSFYALGSTTSVQKALSRLSKEGVIVRVAKGIYSRPKPLASLPAVKMIAKADHVARVWAKENGYKLAPQGLEEAYRLGLQTQAPVRKVYWSNGPSRVFKVGNEVVRVKHITEQKLKWLSTPEGALLRGLSVITPSEIESAGLYAAFKRLSLSQNEISQVIAKLLLAPIKQVWRKKLIEFNEALPS